MSDHLTNPSRSAESPLGPTVRAAEQNTTVKEEGSEGLGVEMVEELGP